jgi:hypothetical protein
MKASTSARSTGIASSVGTRWSGIPSSEVLVELQPGTGGVAVDADQAVDLDALHAVVAFPAVLA